MDRGQAGFESSRTRIAVRRDNHFVHFISHTPSNSVDHNGAEIERKILDPPPNVQ